MIANVIEAPLTLRPATEADLPTLVRLRDEAAHWMLAQGIDQWRPGQLTENHFRHILTTGEIWLAADKNDHPQGAFELWWQDEDAWGPQPPTAAYVHRLMTSRTTAPPGTGRTLLQAAEARTAATGRTLLRLDCAADNPHLNAYYEKAGYRTVGHKSGKPQPAGAPPKSFTLREKKLPSATGTHPPK
ncbi:GNAT family N-acetyltransferase [Streptomyces polyrhachis]|uniref:GNAT family N-acetyltransferase n=1 Tax=Streptomyces polyrhachis TaxID=1282885 RepID=A0ABW2GK69_9ACTN